MFLLHIFMKLKHYLNWKVKKKCLKKNHTDRQIVSPDSDLQCAAFQTLIWAPKVLFGQSLNINHLKIYIFCDEHHQN